MILTIGKDNQRLKKIANMFDLLEKLKHGGYLVIGIEEKEFKITRTR